MANYEAMTNKELQELCKENGLSTSGPKAILIARLKQGKVNEADVIAETAKTEKSEFAINAMRSALIAAHKLNNRKAITADQATMAGVSDAKYKEWVNMVEELHQKVETYNDLRHTENSTDEQRNLAEGRIYPLWRKCVACGESDEDKKFHKRWFIRPTDVSSLVGYDEVFYATEMGTQMGHATATVFRKKVETLIGWRITGNMVLNDKDRDDLLEYERAVKAVKVATERLNGYTKGDNHIKGLIEKIADMENQIKTVEDTLRQLGQDDNQIAESPIVVPFKVQLKTLKGEKESTEKNKTTNAEIIRKLEERAKQIYATLNPIDETIE